MKIKSIAAICKKNKQVVLFNRYSDSGTISQYIGDGNAVYPISGLPELDEESILTIFDVPEKQREDWLVQYRDIPEGISFTDRRPLWRYPEKSPLRQALKYSRTNWRMSPRRKIGSMAKRGRPPLTGFLRNTTGSRKTFSGKAAKNHAERAGAGRTRSHDCRNGAGAFPCV